MAKCQNCGKSPQFGQNRPFSLKTTKRRFNANIQNATIVEGGRKQRVKLCTRCIRTMAKNGSL